MIIDSLKIAGENSVRDSINALTDQTAFGTPLSRILLIAGIIAAGSLLYLAYHKWIVPEKIKNSVKYKKDSYKDIDGC
ncbi:hypothetical protein BMS3Abin03_00458 [bacterium BMS3Abin03]|nr:hypothetical protein BMS3Abin03_00458 [bacterium BMS3Abin03]